MTEYYNLLLLLACAIAYLFAYGKMLDAEFKKNFGSHDYSFAVKILKTASLAASSITLVETTIIASNANRFFLNAGDWTATIIFNLSIFSGICLLSYVIYRISYFIVSKLTRENELDALRKDDIGLALYHAVILITISFVLSPPLMKIASSFIPYPRLPF
jgi:hypothetical protein